MYLWTTLKRPASTAQTKELVITEMENVYTKLTRNYSHCTFHCIETSKHICRLWDGIHCMWFNAIQAPSQPVTKTNQVNNERMVRSLSNHFIEGKILTKPNYDSDITTQLLF